MPGKGPQYNKTSAPVKAPRPAKGAKGAVRAIGVACDWFVVNKNRTLQKHHIDGLYLLEKNYIATISVKDVDEPLDQETYDFTVSKF